MGGRKLTTKIFMVQSNNEKTTTSLAVRHPFYSCTPVPSVDNLYLAALGWNIFKDERMDIVVDGMGIKI